MRNQDETFDFIQVKADQGDAKAQFDLGELFEQQHSFSKAYHYYFLSAKQRYSPALFRLGKCFQYGIGSYPIDISLDMAISYYKLAANQGYAPALKMIGWFYEHGKEVEKSTNQAFQYYSLAANIDFSCAWDEIFRCLLNGIGIESSTIKAFQYCQRAANLDIGKAIYLLSLCYKYGIGAEENQKKSQEYFRIAIAKKVPEALYHLGFESELDRGCLEKAYRDALGYFQLLSSQDKAKNILSEYCKDDITSQDSLKTAFSYYKFAAEQKFSPAQNKVADCYAYGLGVEQSWTEAVKYYQLAASQGRAQAQCDLGTCYEYGLGVDKNLNLALQYYRLSSEQNDSQGLCHFALCNEFGIGTEFSQTIALRSFKLACNNGDLCGFFHIRRHQQLFKQPIEQAINDYYQNVLLPQFEIKQQEKLRVFHEQTLGICGQSMLSFYNQLRNQILFPNAKPLDIRAYLKDSNLETLKAIFEQTKGSPSYLHVSNSTKQEMDVISQAMIANPKLTVFCLREDIRTLLDSFQKAGYNPHKCLKCQELISRINQEEIFGFLFIGNSQNNDNK